MGSRKRTAKNSQGFKTGVALAIELVKENRQSHCVFFLGHLIPSRGITRIKYTEFLTGWLRRKAFSSIIFMVVHGNKTMS